MSEEKKEEVKKVEEKKAEQPASVPTPSPVPVQTPIPSPTNPPVVPIKDPLDDLSEEDRGKVEAVRAFYADQSPDALLRGYQAFGKSKAEREKVWVKWTEIAKEDSSAVFKGIVIPNREPKLVPSEPTDLTQIKDEKVRDIIIRKWLEQKIGKNKVRTTHAEVRS